MVTVTTKEALEQALKNGEDKIFLQGEIAKSVIKKKKIKKGTMFAGGILIVAGLALLPFSGGSSSAAIGAGLTVVAGGTTVVISAAELAMILGSIVSVSSLAIIKGYTIKVGKDYVELTKN